jgi:hypothetical protein
MTTASNQRAVFYFVISFETSHCPVCQSQLNLRGTRKRGSQKNEEEKQKLVIRRMYCEACKNIHHELPDCIVPYKRYCAEVIENIVNSQTAKEALCPGQTLRRIRGWWAVANANYWIFAHQLCTRFEARPT